MKNKVRKDDPFLFRILREAAETIDTNPLVFSITSFNAVVFLSAFGSVKMMYSPVRLVLGLLPMYLFTELVWMAISKTKMEYDSHNSVRFSFWTSVIMGLGALSLCVLGGLNIVFGTAISIKTLGTLAFVGPIVACLLYVVIFALLNRQKTTIEKELIKGELFNKDYSVDFKKDFVLEVIVNILRELPGENANVSFVCRQLENLYHALNDSPSSDIVVIEAHYNDLLTILRVCRETPRELLESHKLIAELNKKIATIGKDVAYLKELRESTEKNEKEIYLNSKLDEALTVLETIQ